MTINHGYNYSNLKDWRSLTRVFSLLHEFSLMGVNISRPKPAMASQYERPPPGYEESLEHEKSDLKAHLGDARSLPKSVDGSIGISNLESWEDSTSSPVHTLARTVLSRTDLSALQRREAHILDTHVFNTEIDFKTGPIANQKQSGRCWLFASTNVLRYSVMRKLNLSEFELSQVCCLCLSFEGHSPN